MGFCRHYRPPCRRGAPPLPEAQKRLVGRSKPFSEVVALYLEEKKLDNNTNTRKAKERTYTDFQTLFSDVDINLLGKPELVQWKTNDIKRDLKAPSVNSRLGDQQRPLHSPPKQPRRRLTNRQEKQTGREVRKL